MPRPHRDVLKIKFDDCVYDSPLNSHMSSKNLDLKGRFSKVKIPEYNFTTSSL